MNGSKAASLPARLLIALRFLGIDLAHNLGRTLLAVSALAAVIASYLVIVAGAHGFAQFAPYFATPQPNLWLMSAGVLTPINSSISLEQVEHAARLVQENFGEEALQAALPLMYRSVRYADKTYALAAVSVTDAVQVFDLQLTQGVFPAPADSGRREVAASSSFLQVNQARLGDTLSIFGSDFTIVGVVQSQSSSLAMLWMDLSMGQQLYAYREDYQVGILALREGVDAAQVQAVLEADPALQGCCAAYLDRQLNEIASGQLATLDAIMRTFQVLALFVVTFGVYNAANLTLVERAREVALLRVAGFTPGEVKGLLAAHYLLFTLAAFGVGWGAAVLYARWNGKVASIGGQVITLQIQPQHVWAGLGLTLAFALAGVWLPARTYFRHSTAEHLRQA
jgi:ABC-type antimicrobial peptide transport system permease subunit